MFEEMSTVWGNNWAKANCAKSFNDKHLDCSSEKSNVNNIERPSNEKDVPSSSNETSLVKAIHKRSRSSNVHDEVSNI